MLTFTSTPLLTLFPSASPLYWNSVPRTIKGWSTTENSGARPPWSRSLCVSRSKHLQVKFSPLKKKLKDVKTGVAVTWEQYIYRNESWGQPPPHKFQGELASSASCFTLVTPPFYTRQWVKCFQKMETIKSKTPCKTKAAQQRPWQYPTNMPTHHKKQLAKRCGFTHCNMCFSQHHRNPNPTANLIHSKIPFVRIAWKKTHFKNLDIHLVVSASDLYHV